jgi:hypothetical protein
MPRPGHRMLQLRTDRRVEVQSLGRDFLREPFVIQLLTFRALVERGGSAIDHLLEGRVILAQHDAIGLGLGECVLGNHVSARLFRSGDEAGEQDVIHHKGRRTIGLDHQERLRVVLGRDDVDAEVAGRIGFGELFDVGGA